MVAESPHTHQITALDHVVIGVRDLDEATRRYSGQGFTVVPGGRHVGRGTHNNLIPLQNSYLELIGVYDEAAAERSGRHELTTYLRNATADGPVAYALQTNDIDATAAGLTAQSIEIVGPFEMQRTGTDGRVVEWRLIVPYGNQYRTWWPFFIQWDNPDRDWPRSAHPDHANRSNAIRDIIVAAEEPGIERTMFEDALGLSPTEAAPVPFDNATATAYTVADTRVVIAAPNGPGELARAVATHGPGVIRIDLDSGLAIGSEIA